jgi:4-hydroxybenzoate polyprenyltransferase
MKILYYLYSCFIFLANITNINCFKISNIKQFKNTRLQLFPDDNILILNKIDKFLDLSRVKNVVPTLLLSFSGGWITNPSISNLFDSKQFISVNLITTLIMSLSMVINDLHDIELDKINNPTRPLVNGEITKKEAIVFSLFLFVLIQFFSINFLTSNLQIITNTALVGVGIYTPILKKITFIKNLFCALTVSFSMFYSSLSIDMNASIGNPILITTIRYIFLGSLMIEILLDICDIDGDKKNNINTLPVIFGVKKSLIFVCFLLLSNIFNVFYLYSWYSSPAIFISSLSFIPIAIDLYAIKSNNYDKKYIKSLVEKTTTPMVIFILYMCLLSYTLH